MNAKSPSCLCSDIRNILIQIKIVGDGDTKAFGWMNLFQYLIMEGVTEYYLLVR